MKKYIEQDLKIYESVGPLPFALIAAATDIFNAEDSLRDMNEKVREYFLKFYIAGAQIEDYANKELVISDELRVITSLRFRNLDVSKPFIEIVYKSAPLYCRQQLEAIIASIEKNYSLPYGFINFFLTPGFMDSLHNLRPRKTLYAKRMDSGPEYTDYRNAVLLHKAEDMFFYDQYISEYEIFHAEYEDNREFSVPEQFGYLKELVTAGQLYEVRINNMFGGIIAYDHSTHFSVSGIEIVEEFVFKKFRTENYASTVQAALIQLLRHNRVTAKEILFGTIHSRNIPAIKTAMNNHRLLLGGWYEY